MTEMQEEYLDVLTEKGEYVESRPRRLCHRLGLWHRVIHLWVINKYVSQPQPSCYLAQFSHHPLTKPVAADAKELVI